MTQETYEKKLRNIISSGDNVDEVVNQLINLTNILKSDIAEGIKEKSQNSGVADFVDVPTAIQIVTDGGIPTDNELIELAQEYMKDGDIKEANRLLEMLKKERVC